MNIGLIFKLLPLLLPLLNGVLKAIYNAQNRADLEIDKAKLEDLVEQLTIAEITRVVKEHKGKITPYVPNEEQKARDERLDELEELLKDV